MVTPFFDAEYLTNGNRYGQMQLLKKVNRKSQIEPKLFNGTGFNDLE